MDTKYKRVRAHGKEEKGHKSSCPFTTNLGPSCDCDGAADETPDAELVRKQIIWAMEMGGWVSERDPSAWPSFHRKMGPHQIVIARVISGWNLVWVRKTGLTILEEPGYGSVGACLSALYAFMAEWMDLSNEILSENMQYKLKEAKEAKPDGVEPA